MRMRTAVAIVAVVMATEPSWSAVAGAASSTTVAAGNSAPGRPALAATAPARPTPVCGSPSLLGGPTAPPPGSAAVATTDDLPSTVQDAPAGTTFWLAPGTHVLGAGDYAQIIPKSGDTFLGAPGATIDGQGQNLYAFAQQATDVTIEYLTITHFGQPGSTRDEGVVNHDSGRGWTMAHDTVAGNAGAGVMLGSGDVLRDSCLTGNGQYGFSAYADGGVHDVEVTGNEVSFNDTDDWEVTVPGCGCAGGAKFWETTEATVTGNYVHDNRDVGIWVDTDDSGFDISGNYIADNFSDGIIYEASYNARIAGNTLVRNGLGEGPANPGFPTGAIYISESGGDRRVGGWFRGSLAITGNVLQDNWSGVVLWESADRFCGSPDNTSSGSCTLVDPEHVNLKTCTRANLAHAEPSQRPVDYYDSCRWKTQNVLVAGNRFAFSPSAIGAACVPANGCGFQGLLSQYGTSPSWSPYHGEAVERAITRRQHDRFADNDYHGPWRFMVHDQGTVVTFAAWRTTWHQDGHSTFAG